MHRGLYSAVVVEPIPGERIDVVQSLGGSILGVHRIIDIFRPLFPSVAVPLDLSDIRQTWVSAPSGNPRWDHPKNPLRTHGY